MKISHIYEKYKIMPQLQLHMYRVAAVATIICDNLPLDIDRETIIETCLLHDIGNIVKFDLQKFPEGLKPQGLKYWSEVKKEFINKYGDNDHKASLKICRELGVSSKILSIIKISGFKDTVTIFRTRKPEPKICKYSDFRVLPDGIGSLDERFEEAEKRYLGNNTGPYTITQFRKFRPVWKKIEEQIFIRAKIRPDHITDKKVFGMIIKLKDHDVKAKAGI